ncbi:MAG: D-aminoacyl-tRNA deacylase [Bacillota bacterium]|nr:D-aminoacyl-tRNA deacylase [Bacillota bacterium]
MRAVVQRVRWARVEVEGEKVGEIGPGLLIFLGVGAEDGEEDAEWLARKLAGLRIFEDACGKMNLGPAEVGAQFLVVSQFTLYGDCRRGYRPSFSRAAPAPRAEELYRQVLDRLKGQGCAVAEGRFQARMQVELCNDGPVTLILDSKE